MTETEGLTKWKMNRSILLRELQAYEKDDVEIPYNNCDQFLQRAVQLLLEVDHHMPIKESLTIKRNQEDQWRMNRHVLLQYMRRYKKAEIKIPCKKQKKLLFSAVDLMFEADRFME